MGIMISVMIRLNQNQCVNRKIDVDTIVGIIHHVDTIVGIIHHAAAYTLDHHVVHIVEDHG